MYNIVVIENSSSIIIDTAMNETDASAKVDAIKQMIVYGLTTIDEVKAVEV